MTNIEKFINLIQNDKFVEAHEVLEDDWLYFKKTSQKDKALFYKGLINGATSIALIIKKRSLRARTITWDAFLKYKDLIDILELENKETYNKVIKLIEQKHLEINT
jgi:guanylate kinase